jgi:all-trans-retinol 13,14-reductase
LVLEAGPIPGGCTSVHEPEGYEFNKGLHSVGDLDLVANPKALHGHALDYVTGGKLEWSKLPNVHEVAALPRGDKYGWASTLEENLGALCQRFPAHARELHRYFDVEEAVQSGGWSWALTKLLPQWVPEAVRRAAFVGLGGAWRRYMGRSLQDVLKDEFHFSDELVTLFAYMYGNYGRTPDAAPFTLHASVMYHYRLGGYYPVGGPAQIAHTIVPIIEAAGGQVAVSSPVKNIIVDDNRAVGVTLEDGQEIRSPLIVSAASAYETFMRMLPPELSRKHGYTKLFDHLGASPAHVYLFAAYDERMELPRHITWQLPDYDDVEPNDIVKADGLFKKELRFKNGPSYVIAPSSRDPAFAQRYPNTSTVIVLTEAGPDWVERCRTDAGFAAELEAKATEGLMDTAHKYLPALRGKTPAYMKVGTPVGCNVRALNGCSYGLEAAGSRFSHHTHALRPQTKVAGLYLTGQDSFFPGIAGAVMSARFTYAALSGDLLHVVSAEKSPLARALPRPESESDPESVRPAA